MVSIGEFEIINKINKLTRIFYLFSINGFILVIVFQSTDLPISVGITGLSFNPAELIMPALLAFVFGIIILLSYIHMNSIKSDVKPLREKMEKTLSKAVENGYIKENRKRILVDRFTRLLEQDAQHGLFSHFNHLMATGNLLNLNRSHRNSIEQILERISLKMGHGEFDEGDLIKIEEIIDKSEEKGN